VKDVNKIESKISKVGAAVPHWEIFVPIVYELYRSGGEEEWTQNRRPWTTPSEYKALRKNLKNDFAGWFKQKYSNQFKLIHATQPIELRDANELWLEQSNWHYPKYKSLDEAYVSFFAFGRYKE